jgi:hypothetical protein
MPVACPGHALSWIGYPSIIVFYNEYFKVPGVPDGDLKEETLTEVMANKVVANKVVANKVAAKDMEVAAATVLEVVATWVVPQEAADQ